MPRFESGARKQAARTGTLPEGVMSVFEHKEFDGHEQVVFCHDPASGLKAIIAIHNTNRGPALGGCRMWPYASEAEALTDVLRLARGMTYTSALAGQIGRESCRERVCQYVSISVVAVSLKKKKTE